jgi:hypothetical protein
VQIVVSKEKQIVYHEYLLRIGIDKKQEAISNIRQKKYKLLEQWDDKVFQNPSLYVSERTYLEQEESRIQKISPINFVQTILATTAPTTKQIKRNRLMLRAGRKQLADSK